MVWGVLLYLLGSVALGIWAARRVRNSQDFLVAGRRLPFLWATSLLFSTWFGSESILGASETFARGGLLAVIEDPFGSALCLFLVGIWLARPFYRLPVRTFGDFYALHFGRLTERVATVLMIISYFGWIAAQLVALGQVLRHFLGGTLPLMTALATALILSYTTWGGMWSVAAVDLMQNVFIIAGLIVLIGFLPEGWTAGLSQLPTGFLDFWPKPEPHAWLEYLAAWMVIGLGSLPQQDMYQRVVSARSEKVARQAGIAAAFLYVSVGLLPLTAGLFIRMHHPEWLRTEGEATAPILRLVEGYMPPGVQFLFWGALIAAIMSSASGGILAPAALLSENLLARWHRLSTLWKARLAVIVVAFFCYLMTLYEQNIYKLVGESSIFSLVTLFWPMVVGLHAPRWRSATGAIVSMIGGIVAYYLAQAVEVAIPPLWYGFGASLLGYIAGTVGEKTFTFWRDAFGWHSRSRTGATAPRAADRDLPA
ncbi:MAG: sodium:solute symporter family protein [Bacteroidia bacterium]|nr:sodium:solute symporter family protein [Bacteroidia bacterium]